MKIVSTNIAEPFVFKLKSREVSTGFFKKSSDKGIYLTTTGIRNDYVADKKHHGGIDKACYVYGANNYTYWKRMYPNLVFEYGMFGENLTLENLNESEISIGDVFSLGEAVIQVTQPRQPCFKLGLRFETQHIVKQFMQAPYPGFYAKVLEEGYVSSGETIQLTQKAINSISLSEAHMIISSKEITTFALQKVLNNEYLASSYKEDARIKKSH